MIEFLYQGDLIRLSKYLKKECPFLSFSAYKELIKKRDIKINGIRIGMREDAMLRSGDEVAIYYNLPKIPIVFEDENIIIIDKPEKVISTLERFSAQGIMEAWLGITLYAVHRLDTNTAGLLILAKSLSAANTLICASKEGNIDKFYLAKVLGEPKVSEQLTAFLVKDGSGKVFVSKNGEGERINTSYKLVKKLPTHSILEVNIKSGKTHQIRAHLAFCSLPILGDCKYGDYEANRRLKLTRQELIASRLVFLRLNGALSALSGREFQSGYIENFLS